MTSTPKNCTLAMGTTRGRTQQGLLYLTSILLFLEACQGFVKSPLLAFSRHPRQTLSIQSLYTTEFSTGTVNQTDVLLPTRMGANTALRPEQTLAQKSAENSLPPKYNLTLLLIDHYDSFTYNLYDLLAQLCENPPIVLAKDSFKDWSEVEKVYGANTIDGVVLSPGPGTPTHPEDIGTLSTSIIQQNPHLPILGVCLGHQIMGHVYGATVDLCGPVHGQVWPIEQQQQQSTDDPIWNDIPSQIEVTRYHSLSVALPSEGKAPLRPTAISLDNGSGKQVLMGMSHTENPHFGVQFHPESIGSQYGQQLLRNFCDVCKKERKNLVIRDSKGVNGMTDPSSTRNGHDRQTERTANPILEEDNEQASNEPKYEVLMHKVPTADLTPLEVFEEFLSNEQYSVWLDTSRGVQSSTADAIAPSYSSILGAGRKTIEYFGKDHNVKDQGLFRYDPLEERTVRVPDHDILTFLQEEHAHATESLSVVEFDADGTAKVESTEEDANLPFDFRGGHVGYLGYEVRHDSERYLEEQERGSRSKWKPVEESLKSPPLPPDGSKEPKEKAPTAAFLFLDKSWVFDHSTEEWYLISLVERDSSSPNAEQEVLEWIKSTARRMLELSRNKTTSHVDSKESNVGRASKGAPKPQTLAFVPNRSPECYNANFADCQAQIRLGESYELCLTNQLETVVSSPERKSPLALYKILRKRNPAPFSAFLNWNASNRKENSNSEAPDAPLAICCSSPERFVSVKRTKDLDSSGSGRSKLQVEAKPIKGTCARVIPKDPLFGLSPSEDEEDKRRALELKESVKNRAENLMIVDLLRNDLSRVCEIGSVHVSKLMDIESYATVHQMVSTIRGTLDGKKANAVDVLKATFPGGSMTGAPKIRTMEILERLEEGVSRGPYSGCLGYISMNGCMDMNIVIRTAVLKPSAESDSEEGQQEWKVSIGAGGAITALSESRDEYDEMILKASAVMKAVEEWADDP